jgi:hypothetical protein
VRIGRYEESIEENQKSELLGRSSPEEAAAEAARMLQAFKTGGERRFYQKNLERTLQTLKHPVANLWTQPV